jgi:fructose-1,6-bisphosphatase/inositol monophosphatase family enzyme
LKGVRQKEKEKLLHLAESSALLAGASLKNQRDKWRNLRTASAHDVKISADQKSESIIINLLAGSNIPILSEEAGSIAAEKEMRKSADTNLLWIIDPLDGSLNYYQGIPLSCVSIALYTGVKPVLGVVFDFNHGELFSGLIGSGAWLNHHPIRTSHINEISKAVLGTGFPVNTDFSGPALSRFISEIQQFRKVRLFGSAALSLCYVACGRIDAYREKNIMLWDVAAGLALVHSAGGVVEVENLEHMDSPANVVASNGFLRIDGKIII